MFAKDFLSEDSFSEGGTNLSLSDEKQTKMRVEWLDIIKCTINIKLLLFYRLFLFKLKIHSRQTVQSQM